MDLDKRLAEELLAHRALQVVHLETAHNSSPVALSLDYLSEAENLSQLAHSVGAAPSQEATMVQRSRQRSSCVPVRKMDYKGSLEEPIA